MLAPPPRAASPPAVWGLISDVHGNLRALAEAVEALRTAGAERLACLGDTLGRGDAEGCVRLLQESADVVLVGNRDLDWQDRVVPATRDWVRTLPRTMSVDGLLLAHGDPHLTRNLSTAQIGRDFRDAYAELAAHSARVLAFGHSHHARVWRKAGPAARAELLAEPRITLDADARYVVNVGTTGLPFPGKGGPSVALVNLRSGVVQRLDLTWWAGRR